MSQGTVGCYAFFKIAVAYSTVSRRGSTMGRRGLIVGRRSSTVDKRGSTVGRRCWKVIRRCSTVSSRGLTVGRRGSAVSKRGFLTVYGVSVVGSVTTVLLLKLTFPSFRHDQLRQRNFFPFLPNMLNYFAVFTDNC